MYIQVYMHICTYICTYKNIIHTHVWLCVPLLLHPSTASSATCRSLLPRGCGSAGESSRRNDTRVTEKEIAN